MEPPYLLLPLTQGYFAKISPEDLLRVLRHGWRVQRSRERPDKRYAAANVKLDGRWQQISLHRFLMQPPPGVLVDHRDGDGLNCTRENMRLATLGNNARNQRKRAGSSSRFRGVSRHSKGDGWVSQAWHDRRPVHLGLFADEIDAAVCYDVFTTLQRDPFSRLNFPIENYADLLALELTAANPPQGVAEGVGLSD